MQMKNNMIKSCSSNFIGRLFSCSKANSHNTHDTTIKCSTLSRRARNRQTHMSTRANRHVLVNNMLITKYNIIAHLNWFVVVVVVSLSDVSFISHITCSAGKIHGQSLSKLLFGSQKEKKKPFSLQISISIYNRFFVALILRVYWVAFHAVAFVC